MDMWNMLGISPTQALQSACKAAVRYAKSAASETNAEIPAKPEVRPQTAPEKEAEPEKKAEDRHRAGVYRVGVGHWFQAYRKRLNLNQILTLFLTAFLTFWYYNVPITKRR